MYCPVICRFRLHIWPQQPRFHQESLLHSRGNCVAHQAKRPCSHTCMRSFPLTFSACTLPVFYSPFSLPSPLLPPSYPAAFLLLPHLYHHSLSPVQRWSHNQPSPARHHAHFLLLAIHRMVCVFFIPLQLPHLLPPATSFTAQVSPLPYSASPSYRYIQLLVSCVWDENGRRLPPAAPHSLEQKAQDECEALALLQQLCNRHLHSFIPKKARGADMIASDEWS